MKGTQKSQAAPLLSANKGAEQPLVIQAREETAKGGHQGKQNVPKITFPTLLLTQTEAALCAHPLLRQHSHSKQTRTLISPTYFSSLPSLSLFSPPASPSPSPARGSLAQPSPRSHLACTLVAVLLLARGHRAGVTPELLTRPLRSHSALQLLALRLFFSSPSRYKRHQVFPSHPSFFPPSSLPLIPYPPLGFQGFFFPLLSYPSPFFFFI